MAQQIGNFPGAIRGAQEALSLTPAQAEYYHILGQYYGALAGESRQPPRADFAPDLAAVRGEPAPERLGRDQLFTLGQLSLEEATRLNPLEARYYSTLGELYRYWAELAQQPERLPLAIASFEHAATLKPNDVEVHAGLSDSYLLAGDPARAFAEGRAAEGLLPGYWYAYAATARAALALGDATTAVTAAGDALRYASANSGVKAPTAYELERLRQVVAQAIATGASPIRAGALLRNDTSGIAYRVDEQGVAHLMPHAVAASCPEVVRGAALLPDPILGLLPQGPDLTGC
jgi:tetratricopeptide (TPR) repeat protein